MLKTHLRKLILMVTVFISLFLLSCNIPTDLIGPTVTESDSLFRAAQNMGQLENSQINEASGLAASIVNSDMLWTHNDSGDQPRVFLIGQDGSQKATYTLANADFRDAEDIAVGPGPGNKSHVFLGDIGDNQAVRSTKQIYYFEEPVFSPQGASEQVIDEFKVINYRYPDGPRDAETLLVDPATGNLFIITKRELQVRLYLLSKENFDLEETVELEFLTELPLQGIVGGDISHKGDEIILKDYQKIYYWERNPDENLATILTKEPKILPYEIEPQGESIAWSKDGSGYFTVSEKVAVFPAILFYYQRIKE